MLKLLELVIVRRILPIVEDHLSPDQYAYQRVRSTETLLSDLDWFVGKNRREDKITYIAGLDIEGAFDSAGHLKLIDSLMEIGVPEILVRFIGEWLTQGTFRVRLGS